MNRAQPDDNVEGKRLVLDVDGVLTDFHARARQSILQHFSIDLPLSHYTEWDVTCVLRGQAEKDRMNSIIAEPGFATSLVPDPEAQAFVELCRSRRVDILFATTPHPESPTWKEEREAWLMANFGASKDEIAHIHKKYFLGGDVFVDDKPSNVSGWIRKNTTGHGRLWRRFYNERAEGLSHVSDWSEVSDLLKL